MTPDPFAPSNSVPSHRIEATPPASPRSGRRSHQGAARAVACSAHFEGEVPDEARPVRRSMREISALRGGDAAHAGKDVRDADTGAFACRTTVMRSVDAGI